MINQKVQLLEDGTNIFPNPNLVGIDINNILYDGGGYGMNYTATEDCYVIMCVNSANTIIYIDDIFFATGVGNSGAYYNICVPLKKGQNIKDGNYTHRIIAYGLKYI